MSACILAIKFSSCLSFCGSARICTYFCSSCRADTSDCVCVCVCTYLWSQMREDWAGCSPECCSESHPRVATRSSGEGCRTAAQDGACGAPHMDWTGCSLDWRTTGMKEWGGGREMPQLRRQGGWNFLHELVPCPLLCSPKIKSTEKKWFSFKDNGWVYEILI